jgi:hypothetical protein
LDDTRRDQLNQCRVVIDPNGHLHAATVILVDDDESLVSVYLSKTPGNYFVCGTTDHEDGNPRTPTHSEDGAQHGASVTGQVVHFIDDAQLEGLVVRPGEPRTGQHLVPAPGEHAPAVLERAHDVVGIADTDVTAVVSGRERHAWILRTVANATTVRTASCVIAEYSKLFMDQSHQRHQVQHFPLVCAGGLEHVGGDCERDVRLPTSDRGVDQHPTGHGAVIDVVRRLADGRKDATRAT